MQLVGDYPVKFNSVSYRHFDPLGRDLLNYAIHHRPLNLYIRTTTVNAI